MGSFEDRGQVESQIESWVRSNVAFPDASHGKCTKVVLRHLDVNRNPQGDVATIPVKLDEGAEGEIDPLLHEIADRAQRDADDIAQGVQLYAVYAGYSGGQSKNYFPRKIFRVSPSMDSEIERDVKPSEPPNERGLVAQTQRHLEAFARLFTVSQTSVIATLQRENDRLSKANEQHATQQVDFMILLQDLVDARHERRLKERDAEAGIAMKESAMTSVQALVPVIVNRIAGKQVLPEEDRSLMLMATMLEGMTEEQQAAMFNMLSDSQKVLLAEIMSEYEKKKSKWMRGQAQGFQGMVKNALPQPTSRSLVPSGAPDTPSTPSTPAAPAAPIPPMPTAMSVKDRVSSTPVESTDPVMRRVEDDLQVLQQRFKDMLVKPTPTGEKKT